MVQGATDGIPMRVVTVDGLTEKSETRKYGELLPILLLWHRHNKLFVVYTVTPHSVSDDTTMFKIIISRSVYEPHGFFIQKLWCLQLLLRSYTVQ